ncbi:hypothetical protein [Thalassobius sp. MITS945101]|uniref:hypothetical protein n=1 Tax=Thalassobius sp. MITS945101 TaxID=3096994 RepID=UPI0039998F23
MSNPVTNVEIEDVLASIRRLVSDEPAQPSVPADKVEKLVLTPALRVNNDAPPTPAQDDAQKTEHETESVTPERPAAMTLGAEYAVAPLPVVNRNDVAEGEPATVAAAEAVTEAAEQPDEAPETAMDRLEGMQAALSVSDELSDDQWEPDGDDEDAFGAADVASMEWVDHTPHESLGAGEDAVAEAPYWADAEPQDVAEVHSLHGDVEAVEAGGFAEEEIAAAEDIVDMSEVEAVEEDAAPIEEVDEGLEEPSAQAAFASSRVPSEASVNNTAADYAEEDYVSEAVSNAALEDLSALDGLGAALDEEALRELVTEIVRQELQGSLGERITRNVRKLVRREIQRALTVQNLQ